LSGLMNRKNIKPASRYLNRRLPKHVRQFHLRISVRSVAAEINGLTTLASRWHVPPCILDTSTGCNSRVYQRV
jgi:hypothetical protein